MYDKIYNPLSKKSFYIGSKQGKFLLKKYLQTLIGGAERESEEKEETERRENKEEGEATSETRAAAEPQAAAEPRAAAQSPAAAESKEETELREDKPESMRRANKRPREDEDVSSSSASNENTSDEDNCAICLNNLDNSSSSVAILRNCRHSFHQACIDQWRSVNQTCPMCRGTLTLEQEVAPAAAAARTSNLVPLNVSRESREQYGRQAQNAYELAAAARPPASAAASVRSSTTRRGSNARARDPSSAPAAAAAAARPRATATAVAARPSRPSREDLGAPSQEDLEALEGRQEVTIQWRTNLSRNIIFFSHQGINYVFRTIPRRRSDIHRAWSILTRNSTSIRAQTQYPVQVQVEADDDFVWLIMNSEVRRL